MTIKQDLSNLVKDYIKIRKLTKDLNAFCEDNAKKCSVLDYHENYLKTLNFESETDAAKKCEEAGYLSKKAFDHRSTSCFYVGPESQFCMEKCVNVHNDGLITRGCCSKCKDFDTIKKYSEKAKLLFEAERQQHEVINALLRRLKFWKQYTK